MPMTMTVSHLVARENETAMPAASSFFSCRPGRAQRGPGPILRSLSRIPGLWVPAFAGRQTSLPLYPGKIRHRAGGFADLVEQLETVFAQNLVVHIDGDFFEESIDARAQFRHGAHGGGKVFLGDGGGGVLLGDVDRFGQRLFFRRRETLGIRRASVALVVLLLLDAQDVRGALDARQQVLAVVSIEEFAERRDPADDH